MARNETQIKYDLSFYQEAISYMKSQTDLSKLDQEKVFYYVAGLSQVYRFTPENEWNQYVEIEKEFMELYLEYEKYLQKSEGNRFENQKISDQAVGKIFDYSNSEIYKGVQLFHPSNDETKLETKNSFSKTIMAFVRFLGWRFCQIHVRDIIRKLDVSNKKKNKTTKLVIAQRSIFVKMAGHNHCQKIAKNSKK